MPVKADRLPTLAHCDSPILVDAKRISWLTSLSVRTIRRLHAAGSMPASKRIGGRVLWLYADIVEWAASGFNKDRSPSKSLENTSL